MSVFNENFWFAVSFIIFIYLAYKPFKKALFSILDAKIEDIKSSIKDAKDLKTQAEELLKQTEEEISKLENIKQETMQDTKKQVAELIQKRTQKMEQELDYKKSQIIDLIKAQQSESVQIMTKELKLQTRRLVEEYFKATNNDNLSDIEIAQFLEKHSNTALKNNVE